MYVFAASFACCVSVAWRVVGGQVARRDVGCSRFVCGLVAFLIVPTTTVVKLAGSCQLTAVFSGAPCISVGACSERRRTFLRHNFEGDDESEQQQQQQRKHKGIKSPPPPPPTTPQTGQTGQTGPTGQTQALTTSYRSGAGGGGGGGGRRSNVDRARQCEEGAPRPPELVRVPAQHGVQENRAHCAVAGPPNVPVLHSRHSVEEKVSGSHAASSCNACNACCACCACYACYAC